MRTATEADARLLDAAVVGGGLGAKYTQPHRAYHNLLHVEDVLLKIEELAPPPEHELALALAAWFHDAVYQPDRDDNEERSAYAAFDAIEQAGGSPALMAEVVRLIRLTASHEPDPDDVAGAVLCDADLAILGASREKYVEYAQAIRQEYVHVPMADYHTGRTRVLRTFLAREQIYSTPYGREHWEVSARANIEAEIACFATDSGPC
ncbi:MAG: metal-dependent phosphohydrolase [Actinomycetes bacterium]